MSAEHDDRFTGCAVLSVRSRRGGPTARAAQFRRNTCAITRPSRSNRTRGCARAPAPITACADLPHRGARSRPRLLLELRTEGLKILEQIEPQSLAALESEHAAAHTVGARARRAAAATLLALRARVGVGLGLFAAVRALPRCSGARRARATRASSCRRGSSAPPSGRRLLVAEVIRLGGLALLLGACALSAAVERALRVVDHALPLALAADGAAGGGAARA